MTKYELIVMSVDEKMECVSLAKVCTPPFFPQILATHNRSIFITK